MDMHTIISFVLSLGSLIGWPAIIRIVMMVIETGRWAWRQWRQWRQHHHAPLVIVIRGNLLIVVPPSGQSTPIVLVRRRQSHRVVRVRRRVEYLSSMRLYP